METKKHEAIIARLDRELRMVQAMKEIASAMSTTIDFDSLLSLIMDKVTGLMDAERSTLYVTDRARGEIWSKVAQDAEVKEIRLPLGKGIAGWVAEHGRTVNIADAYSDTRFDHEIDRTTGYTTRTLLCVPIRDKEGGIIGVIQALNKRAGPFGPEDEELLAALASQASLALEYSGLYAQLAALHTELEKKYGELDILYQIEKEISDAEGLDHLLDPILKKGMSTIGAEAGSVLLLDEEDEGRLFFKSALGEKGEEVKRFRPSLGDGIAGIVTSSGEPIICNSAGDDPRHSRAIAQEIGYAPRNIICAPLVYGGRTLGAIELLNKAGGGDFTDGDLKLLTLICGQVAKAIDIFARRAERERGERLATIGQLLSSLLHDFKTPMTIISGYVQLLAVEPDAAKRAQHAELVLKQFDLLNIMTREVLAYARGESQVLVRKIFVGKFIEEMRDLLVRDFQDHNVKLAVDLRYEGAARLDDSKLKRVIFNIARNAREAMPRGGTFTLTTAVEGGDLVFTMTDTGEGVPEEIAGKLFKHAFVTQGKAGGTGLGLAVVKKIVDEHGGSITFNSSRGRGTTFVLRIPLQQP
ncbi:MAG: GAF domain-containing protein [Deltaproteobacteria bacterium]|nr:GAF domain-containing protein [Deltaproteobacteria bacterium]